MNAQQAVSNVEVKFSPPFTIDETSRWSKREVLEMVKPHLRAHDSDPLKKPSWDLSYDEKQLPGYKYREARWSWIYLTLREGGNSTRRWLSQARNEIDLEDRYGHYWAPASATYRLIDEGWQKWEVVVRYPRPIHQGKGISLRTEDARFRSKRRAMRWAERRQRKYAIYVQRLLAAGLYDSYEYE